MRSPISTKSCPICCLQTWMSFTAEVSKSCGSTHCWWPLSTLLPQQWPRRIQNSPAPELAASTHFPCPLCMRREDFPHSAGFTQHIGLPHGSVVKKILPANAANMDSILGLGRSSGEGNGHPLQHSCLENPMVRGAWWAAVHGVARVRRTHTAY